jgi:hypothetical protein
MKTYSRHWRRSPNIIEMSSCWPTSKSFHTKRSPKR